MSAHRMKFPTVPGKTPFERFENLVRHVISVPKAALQDKKRRKTIRKAVKHASA